MPARHCTHQGLTAWFGTDDAPAPGDSAAADASVGSGGPVRLVVGVAPALPSNAVHVRYRADNLGPERVLYGRLLHAASTGTSQYFEIVFPYLTPGTHIKYRVFVTSAGRFVPDPATPDALACAFTVERSAARIAPNKPAHDMPADTVSERLPFEMEFWARFQIFLTTGPEVIGATPEGLKVDWYPSHGVFNGPKVSGTVKGVGGDWMTIRPDGIGVMNVRATLVMHDGALVYDQYTGLIEWGENGYTDFLHGKRRPILPARHSPRLLTADSRYLWLNRLQFFAIGAVHTEKHEFVYDVYIPR